jgi:L-alanine-DL-glutamate epimerase-like enolase superfamily enzyme
VDGRHVIWELPLEIDGYDLERLKAGDIRHTTLIKLRGGGHEGVGEEIGGPGPEHHDAFAAQAPLPLAGTWTLESFCDHLATLEQWEQEPEWGDMMRRWRNWAYESAALDLALRQAGLALHEALGREPRPLTFVNSLGLGDEPSADTIVRRLERYPTVGFKLDAAPNWSPEIIEVLAGTGAVRTIDFKGRYGLEVADEEALGVLYDAVLEAFPDAIFEDPHEQYMDRLDGRRVAFDAPIARVEDITTEIVNIKPSRIGGLRPLLEIYAHCDANGILMYGGGMGELGPARGQVELLASIFHPDSPNDVAPSAFNLPEPPPGLPASPYDPGSPPPGFRWS